MSTTVDDTFDDFSPLTDDDVVVACIDNRHGDGGEFAFETDCTGDTLFDERIIAVV